MVIRVSYRVVGKPVGFDCGLLSIKHELLPINAGLLSMDYGLLPMNYGLLPYLAHRRQRIRQMRMKHGKLVQELAYDNDVGAPYLKTWGNGQHVP